MLYDKKMFLIKVVQKKGNKKPKTNNKRKEKNQRKKKMRQNESEVKNVLKKFVKISIITKYCILLCQNFPPSKISGYSPLMK